MNYQQNSMGFGAAVGFAVPFVGLAVLLMLNEQIATLGWATTNGGAFYGFSERLLYILAICLNLIPFRIFRTRRMDNALRATVFPTVLYVGYWVYKFRDFIFE